MRKKNNMQLTSRQTHKPPDLRAKVLTSFGELKSHQNKVALTNIELEHCINTKYAQFVHKNMLPTLALLVQMSSTFPYSFLRVELHTMW